MERIEKILKKLDKDIEDEDIQRYKDCLTSKLDSYLADVNDQYLNAKACFEKELEYITQKTIDEVLDDMAGDLATMEQAQKSIDYISKIRNYIFEELKQTKSIKGFKK